MVIGLNNFVTRIKGLKSFVTRIRKLYKNVKTFLKNTKTYDIITVLWEYIRNF